MANLKRNTLVTVFVKDLEKKINDYLSAGLDPATIKVVIDYFSSITGKAVAEMVQIENKQEEQPDQEECNE